MTPRSAKILPLLLLSALLPSGAALPDVDEWCSPENPEGCDAGQKPARTGARDRPRKQADGPRTTGRKACSLYLAPSTVPGAGLGLFSGRSVPKDWSVHEYASYCEDEPEHIPDAESTMWTDLFVTVWNRDKKDVKWAEDYVWRDPESGHGGLEGDVYLCEDGRRGERDTALLSPASVYAFGIGSLANSHPSLANVRRFTDRFEILKQDENHKAVLDPAAGHQTRPGGFVDLQAPFDAGVGAFQPTYGNDYYSTKKIKAGQEILLNYGNKWHAEMEKKKQDAEGEDGDAEPTSAEMSKSDTVRSVDWLEENGMCLFDATITMSPTRLPEAARGAFVNRKVRQGEVLATSPVIVVRRDDLLVSNSEHSGRYQILLNYAFGHPDSSVLLVPMAPVVEYINHAPPSGSVASDGDKKKKKRKGDPATNAAVRWPEAGSAATRLYGEKESWLGMSVDEVAEMSGRIAIEYVATADIEKGSEVYVDYGAGWDKSWRDFVRMHPYERAGYFRREMAAPDGMYPEGWLDLLAQ